MNSEIQALYELQQRDRQLTRLERKLQLIPRRLRELDDDIVKLETMLKAEGRKCEETRAFQRNQAQQLAEEEDMLRNSRAKMQQVKNPRELTALQREVEQTRRMATARAEEIEKIKQAVIDTETRIASVSTSLEQLKAQAGSEKERLLGQQGQVEGRIGKLRSGRGELTQKIERGLLRTYDRIRERVGGVAFVAAAEGRCTACKMHVPHQVYTQLRKGDEIPSCESCGRLLYFIGHFPKEEEEQAKAQEAKPKASPAKKRPAALADEDD